MPLAFLLRTWRYWAALVVLLAIGAAVVNYGHHRYLAGKAVVQAEFDAFLQKTRAAADEIAQQNQKAEAAAAARNEVLAHDYDAKVAAATADRDRLAGLLKRARLGASAGGTAQSPDIAPAPDASTAGSAEAPRPVADRGAELDAAIAAVIVEASTNAAQLDALIAEIKPQLP